jgi:hypothetical protein
MKSSAVQIIQARLVSKGTFPLFRQNAEPATLI